MQAGRTSEGRLIRAQSTVSKTTSCTFQVAGLSGLAQDAVLKGVNATAVLRIQQGRRRRKMLLYLI